MCAVYCAHSIEIITTDHLILTTDLRQFAKRLYVNSQRLLNLDRCAFHSPAVLVKFFGTVQSRALTNSLFVIGRRNRTHGTPFNDLRTRAGRSYQADSRLGTDELELRREYARAAHKAGVDITIKSLAEIKKENVSSDYGPGSSRPSCI
jgi:hypothetical protein